MKFIMVLNYIKLITQNIKIPKLRMGFKYIKVKILWFKDNYI